MFTCFIQRNYGFSAEFVDQTGQTSGLQSLFQLRSRSHCVDVAEEEPRVDAVFYTHARASRRYYCESNNYSGTK